MSGLLLDTHVMLWLLDDSPRLGSRARRRISAAGAVYVSAASTWELSLKAAVGKIALPAGFGDAVAAAGLRDLPVTRDHTLTCDLTRFSHRDPFDALLAAQADAERLTLVTADAKLLTALPDALDARH